MRFKQFLIEYDQDNKIKHVNIGRRTFDNYGSDPSKGASGVYSRVMPAKDEHMVKKQSINPEQAASDGYWSYADALLSTGIYKENPYFPRLYNVKKYKGKGHRIHYKAEIEKLESLQDIIIGISKDNDILIPYMERIIDYNFKMNWDEINERQLRRNKINLLMDISDVLRNIVEYGYFDIADDPLLKQAAQFIYKLGGDKDFNIDIHYEYLF